MPAFAYKKSRFTTLLSRLARDCWKAQGAAAPDLMCVQPFSSKVLRNFPIQSLAESEERQVVLALRPFAAALRELSINSRVSMELRGEEPEGNRLRNRLPVEAEGRQAERATDEAAESGSAHSPGHRHRLERFILYCLLYCPLYCLLYCLLHCILYCILYCWTFRLTEHEANVSLARSSAQPFFGASVASPGIGAPVSSARPPGLRLCERSAWCVVGRGI